MKFQRSILVLDDEPNLCRVLEAKLAKSSFNVSVATDAADAFRQILSQRFDLILLDYRLPDANGLELLPRLRSIVPSTPVLLMTAYESDDLRGSAVSLGAVDVLYKPFDLNVLAQMVARIIESGAPPLRPAPLVGQTLPIGKIVSIRSITGEEHGEFTANIVSEQIETFAVSATSPVSPTEGTPVSVTLTGSDALYEFRSKIVRDAGPSSLTLVKPAVIHRRQRRGHPRRPLQQPVTVRPDEESASSTTVVDTTKRPAGQRTESAASTVIHGMSLDVSASGMRIAIPGELPVGSRISLAVEEPLEDELPFLTEAVVLRSEQVAEAGPQKVYLAAVRFEDSKSQATRAGTDSGSAAASPED